MSSSDQFRPVQIEEFDTDYDLNKQESEFIQSLKRCEDKIIGAETVGNFIEFYDEDGSILLSVEMSDDESKATFEFALCEKSFNVKLEDSFARELFEQEEYVEG